jgi:tubulin polyglutamylase TTLL9
LDIVDLEGKRDPPGKLDLRMGGFDLIWDNGPVMRFDKPTSMPTMLGKARAGVGGWMIQWMVR